jgi:signal transduction histidine kinase
MTRVNGKCRGHFMADISEFVSALADPYTYSPRNPDVFFGLLWGLPIPFVTMTIHVYAAGMPIEPASFAAVLAAYPAYLIFAAHPLLFAIIFGALGTKICRRDERISQLLQEEVGRGRELAEANSRLTELDRLKSEFLANVTHELKSPLVTALGYTDRILGKHLGEVNERQAKGLEVSKRNLLRLRMLIDEILDFSRLEAGMAKFDMCPSDLRDIVAVAIENLTLKARERRINIAPSAPLAAVNVHGDAHKLCQVVTNLLDNAIKFTPDGGEIRIEIQRCGKDWHLAVIDHGKGVPAHIIPTLFARFSQADGSLSRPHNGVGLGLVIVRKIVDAHGGRVWLDSAEGKGTTVHVTLPALDVLGNQKELKEVEYANDSTH